MTEFLAKTFYYNTVQEWAISLFIILGGVILARAIYWIFGNVAKKVASRTTTRLDDILIDMLEEPIVLAMVILGMWVGFDRLSFPEGFVNWSHRVFHVLIAINITWLIARTVDALISEYVVPIAQRTDNTLDDQIILVAKKGVIWIIWILGVIVALNNAGYNVTALLTGLGIGGLAMAMAAKDTVANIFGGITIFVDKPFKLGQRIEVSGFDGFVEDIGIRSTRIRTLAGRLVIIPNHKFSDQIVENITVEPTRRVVLKLGLTYGTASERMEEAIGHLKQVTIDCEGVQDESITAFTEFADFSLIITHIYYIKKEYNVFETTNEMNLRILKTFNQNGLEFAFPTRTVYTKAIG
jgi:MscS family membrane protein